MCRPKNKGAGLKPATLTLFFVGWVLNRLTIGNYFNRFKLFTYGLFSIAKKMNKAVRFLYATDKRNA